MNIAPQAYPYQDRMDRIVDYIYAHLDSEIDLDQLAEIACLSRFHWHRTYKALSGETLAATVKRLRLHRAATQLAQSKMPMDKIIKQSGYGSASAFSRAFSQMYRIPPAQYRERGTPSTFLQKLKTENDAMHKVEIRELDQMTLVGLHHKGAYMDIGIAFEKLGAWGQKQGLFGPGNASMALYYDDPDLVPTAELRSFAGMLEIHPVELSAPFERITVEPGKFAVMQFKGPYSELSTAYNWLYGTWLEGANVELRDAPCMEDYLNNPRLVAPSELLTDIFMPIK